MIEYIRNEFALILKNSDWMDATSVAKAKEKVIM